MIYSQVYAKYGKAHVTAGLIGSGHYNTAVLGQSMHVPLLDIPVVAETNHEAAMKAFKYAGIPEEDIVRCDSRLAALRALEKGKYVLLEDPMLMMGLPLDVIVEGTGLAEAGASFALAAIENGKHVAMINKEADSVTGPYLKYLADRAGLVYTQVDGDQHGLLIGLVQWARSLGLDIICGSKSPDNELALDRENMRITIANESLHPAEDKWISITKEQMQALVHLPGKPEEKRKVLAKRGEIFKDLFGTRNSDVCETQIAANALGLALDAEKLYRPILRTTELPCVLCPEENGGILHGNGRFDMVTLLRDVDDCNMGGGVFIIVSSKNEYARYILTSKGLHHSPDGMASLIPRPYHLCGVETSSSILNAGSLGISSIAGNYLPNYDVYSKTLFPVKAGETLDSDDDVHIEPFIAPARALKDGSPLHAYIGHRMKLKRDIPAGTTITADMVDIPAHSDLVKLRREQDKHFGLT
jgi:predicted homoserine dehydrogenase-like protein